MLVIRGLELQVSSPQDGQVVRQRPEGLGFSLLAQTGDVRAGGDGGDVLRTLLSSQRHHGPPGSAMAGVQAIQVLTGFVEDVDGIEDVGHSILVSNVDHIFHSSLHLTDRLPVLKYDKCKIK